MKDQMTHAEAVSKLAELAAADALLAQQAKIDSLMLEFCPEEMTPEQTEEWARNQRPYAENAALKAGSREKESES